MTKQETALRACEVLEKQYPESVCALQYEKPYELLISVRLLMATGVKQRITETEIKVSCGGEEFFAKGKTADPHGGWDCPGTGFTGSGKVTKAHRRLGERIKAD